MGTGGRAAGANQAGQWLPPLVSNLDPAWYHTEVTLWTRQICVPGRRWLGGNGPRPVSQTDITNWLILCECRRRYIQVVTPESFVRTHPVVDDGCLNGLSRHIDVLEAMVHDEEATQKLQS